MNYKLAYIIPLKYTEKEIPQIIEKINKLIKSAGVSDIKEESWNKRKIAYPIKQDRHGYFVAAQISAEPENLAKINQELNNLPETLRHSIVKFKPGSFDQTKKSRQEQPSDKEGEKISSQIDSIEQKTVQELIRQPAAKHQNGASAEEKKASNAEGDAQPSTLSSSKDAGDSSKKDDKPKIALEDLDKKLEEILSSDNLKT